MFRKCSIGILVALVFALVLGGIVSAQGPAGGRTRVRWLAPIAEKLGMTVEELQEALTGGQTIQKLAEAEGVELGWPDRLGDRFPRDRASLAPLAEKLGMTVEELQAALDAGETVHELAEAKGVELARDQPDEWRKRELDWPDHPGGRFPRGGAPLAPTADRLGMTVEELQAAFDAGQTIQELAEAKGVDLGFRNLPDGARGRGLWGGKDSLWLAPIAEKLGMTVEELQAALDAGQTIQKLAEAEGLELGWPDRLGGRWDWAQREDE